MISNFDDWRVDLIKAHPTLFHPPVGAPEAARGYPNCGIGWRGLLNNACARIEEAIGERESFTVLQIKERFAVLRFDWRASLSIESEAKIVDAVTKAEARSACTCAFCGREGRLYRTDGILKTCCAFHANGCPVEFTPSRNVHIVRRIVGGRLQGISCYRYDRATDTFIDLLPNPLVDGIQSSKCEGAKND